MAQNPSRTDDLFDRVLDYQNDLIGFFTGESLDENRFRQIREDLLENPAYGDLAPKWIRRNRDLSALWSFAKSVDGSWEPRRQFLREEFEPLLDHLERGGAQAAPRMPGPYDASAWTGVASTAQQAKAIKTLIPVSMASIEILIAHLEAPSHNGGPLLDEIEHAIKHLRDLHASLGELLKAAESGQLKQQIANGLLAEIARYGRQLARSLKHDPIPYALSGALLAIFTACGLPGLGGYLGGIAAAMRKPTN